jgi:hypothetical protein
LTGRGERKKKLRGNKVSQRPRLNSFLWTVDRILWTQLTDLRSFRVFCF